MPPAHARAASLTGSAAGSSTASAPAAERGRPLLLASRPRRAPGSPAPGPRRWRPGRPRRRRPSTSTRLARLRRGPVAQGEQARAVALGEGGRPRPRRGTSGSAVTAEPAAATTWLAKPPSPAETSTRSPDRQRRRRRRPPPRPCPADSVPGTKGTGGLIWYCPATNRRVDVVHARRLHVDDDLARPRLGVGPLLHPQQRGWTELVADDGAHGRSRYRRQRGRRQLRSGRSAPDELALLPAARGGGRHHVRSARHRAPARSGHGRGVRRPPSSCWWPATRRSASAASTRIGGGAHLEQLSVHPDHGGRGIGRALLRAGCDWAGAHGYPELTLATYRDVPWNGPFYASEGFVEVGPGGRLAASPTACAPEEPVMAPLRRPRPHGAGACELGVAEAADQVVVDQPGRLQVGVADGRARRSRSRAGAGPCSTPRTRATSAAAAPCAATC